MNCSDVQKYAYTYLDGEFDERDRREFECHLAACAPCRHSVEENAGFRSALRRNLRCDAAGADVRARLDARLAACEGRSFGDSARIPLAMAAALALCVVGWRMFDGSGAVDLDAPTMVGPAVAGSMIGVLPRPMASRTAAVTTRPAVLPASRPEPAGRMATQAVPQPGMPEVMQVAAADRIDAAPEVLGGAVDASFLTERSPFGAVRTGSNLRALVRSHASPLPLEVRGSAEDVRRWLRERVPGVQGPPISEGAGVTLHGARLSQLAGRPVVLYAYTAFDKPMTVVQHLRAAGRTPFDDPEIEQRQPGEPEVAGSLVDHLAGFQVMHTLRDGELLSVVSELDSGALRSVVQPPTFL
ncbi:MAG: hypothetical protein RIT45_1758 [Pseudomonadota bacterium]